jgi:hypothetical protein
MVDDDRAQSIDLVLSHVNPARRGFLKRLLVASVAIMEVPLMVSTVLAASEGKGKGGGKGKGKGKAKGKAKGEGPSETSAGIGKGEQKH